MPTYVHASVLDAPFDVVWQFHAEPAGLLALTPGMLGLEVRAVEYPECNAGAGLSPGTDLTLAFQPVPGGPAVRWVARITHRSCEGRSGMFRDELLAGPIPRWVHTHRFVDVNFGTLVYDHVSYRSPRWLPEPVFRLGLALMFRDRHRRLQTLLA